MSRFQSSITKTGPFFQRDPAKTFRANIQDAMNAVAEVGEREVAGVMSSGRPISATGDHVRDHVKGRTRSVSGKRWEVSAVVSVYTAGMSAVEATSVLAAASVRESKDHAFRKTAGRMKRARAVNTAVLLKGLT